MNTPTLNISLLGQIKEIVDEDELENSLLEGRNSGEPVEYTRDAFEILTRQAIDSSIRSNAKAI